MSCISFLSCPTCTAVLGHALCSADQPPNTSYPVFWKCQCWAICFSISHCALNVKGMQPALVYLLAAPAWKDSLSRTTESIYLWGFGAGDLHGSAAAIHSWPITVWRRNIRRRDITTYLYKQTNKHACVYSQYYAATLTPVCLSFSVPLLTISYYLSLYLFFLDTYKYMYEGKQVLKCPGGYWYLTMA